jgi:hypothetical protein
MYETLALALYKLCLLFIFNSRPPSRQRDRFKTLHARNNYEPAHTNPPPFLHALYSRTLGSKQAALHFCPSLMDRLSLLPAELKIKAFCSVDNTRDLFNLLQTSRIFSQTWKANMSAIFQRVVSYGDYCTDAINLAIAQFCLKLQDAEIPTPPIVKRILPPIVKFILVALPANKIIADKAESLFRRDVDQFKDSESHQFWVDILFPSTYYRLWTLCLVEDLPIRLVQLMEFIQSQLKTPTPVNNSAPSTEYIHRLLLSLNRTDLTATHVLTMLLSTPERVIPHQRLCTGPFSYLIPDNYYERWSNFFPPHPISNVKLVQMDASMPTRTLIEASLRSVFRQISAFMKSVNGNIRPLQEMIFGPRTLLYAFCYGFGRERFHALGLYRVWRWQMEVHGHSQLEWIPGRQIHWLWSAPGYLQCSVLGHLQPGMNETPRLQWL